MPSYLDFNSTKAFRDALISKTLQAPNGPQTFSAASYSLQNTSNLANRNNGDVVVNDRYDRANLLKDAYAVNRFGPENDKQFIIIDNVQTIPAIGNLALYPYFDVQDVLGRSLIGALNSENYEFESKLAQFSNRYLKESPDGPVQSRIRQNLQTATLGRLRILDAINGNTATAINILRGKENLVEKNYKVTVAKSVPGKIIDFVQTVAGVEFPFSEIPGQYLSDPANPINYRPEPKTGFGALLQDITGAIGSIVGIQRRPKRSSKPSDLMYEYMGSGQKDILHDNLSYSTYKPDYTTVARSQQSSRLFNFPNSIAQGIKNLVGAEAPRGNAYIGDDRGENVLNILQDFNDNKVLSPYYLSYKFDSVASDVFSNQKNISEGGQIAGKLTWYSKNSKNKIGLHNLEFESERSKFEESVSTRNEFREDSILAKTQELLNSMPLDGAASRSHVGNVIDQTSRIFREGNEFISRGSAIKYVNKVTGKEDGTEYCRVWTKDRAYMNYSDTMKRTGLIRLTKDSVISTPWNLNIAPISNGQRDFKGSTNIEQTSSDPLSGKAKKYMFSIENLSWKTSNKPGFTVEDLPICERGANGGRVMWFPPYDLKVNEVNTANWDTTKFLGRPEPIYTYKDTERSGTVSFKVVVDHPSILNLLIKDITDEEAENYLNAFFAGCEDVDFYTLVRKYTTLDRTDIELIKDYLDYFKNGNTTDVTNNTIFKRIAGDTTVDKDVVIEESTAPGPPIVRYKGKIYFPNDHPKTSNSIYADRDYDKIYTEYTGQRDQFLTILNNQLQTTLTVNTNNNILDREVIFGDKNPLSIPGTTLTSLKDKKRDEIIEGFDQMEADFSKLSQDLAKIKESIEKNEIVDVTVKITSTTSFVASEDYNILLSYRRSDSIVKYVVKTLSKNGEWPSSVPATNYWKATIPQLVDGTTLETRDESITVALKDMGWGEDINGSLRITFTNKGENAVSNNEYDCNKLEVKNRNLQLYAPVTFFCRSSELELQTKTKSATIPGSTIPGKTTIGPERIEIINDRTEKNRKPPLDVVKRIIMKTLSECFYFKKLEETDPVVFTSLKEKLKYFHPAFHSTTPEGLNARLTFLQQCLRPGDTIPIKGLGTNTNLSLDARNTTFGPPPICVLRIGDFYHSKIVITNLNISFDNTTWDFNPEGIGMQPMIADVTLQINFIGGHGIKEPVAKLQNALSSNFYANTEIYDYRADSTVDQKELIAFNIDFLEKLYTPDTPNSATSETSSDDPINGTYIGTLDSDKLNYSTNIKSLIDNTNNYFKVFGETYNEIQKLFGVELLPLFISPTYRTINQIDVQNTTSATQVSLLGAYKKGSDFSNLLDKFKEKLLAKVSSSDHNLILDLDMQSGSTKYERSRKIIDPLILTYVTDFIKTVEDSKNISGLENARNLLIEDIDKLNFILSTNGIDAKVDDNTVTAQSLTDFQNTDFYEKYSDAFDLISSKHSIFTSDLDTTFDFSLVNFTDENYKKILSFIIKDKIENIKTEYTNSPDDELFNDNTIKKIGKRVDRFIKDSLNEAKDKKFKYKEVKIKKEIEPYAFTTGTLTSGQEEVIKKIHNTKDFSTTTRLNFIKSSK